MNCEFVDYSRPACEKEEHRIPCFCSNNTSAGEDARRNACNKLGIPGEWKYRDTGGDTCYHYPNSVIEGGNIVGTSAVCTRASYKGSIEECCHQPGSCFSSNGGTCDPEARSYTGTKCQNYFLNYCDPPNFNSFKERWQVGGICRRVLEENALQKEYKYVSELGNVMMKAHFDKNFISEYPGEIQNIIYDVCKETPLACDRYLDEKLCTGYTREELTKTTYARRFCGCHLKNEEYATDLAELAGSTKECDSICVSSTNIRHVDSYGEPLYCNKSICVIDSITIDLIDSSVGDINFKQLCGDCGDAGCICIIKDVEVVGEGNKLGDINLEQECEGGERCYQTADNGELVEVDCDVTPEEKVKQANEKTESTSWGWIIGGIAVALLILIVIIIIFVILIKKS